MKNKIMRIVHFAAFIGLVFSAGASQAGFYTSQAAFLTANPGLALQNFEVGCSGICPVPAFAGFSASGPNLSIADGPSFGAPSDWLADNTYNGSISLNFVPGANAVGFNVSSGFISANVIISIFDGVNLLDTQALIASNLANFDTFVGWDGLGNISGLQIVVNNADAFVNIDNLYFGSAVPEPASLALVVLGLAGLGTCRRRSSKA
jgi:hypothetical protein